MSAGLSFIRACIDNGARGTFAGVGRSLYTPEEYRILDFVQGYVARFGSLPPYPVMVENQMALAPATGPVDYYLNRLSDRAVYTAYQSRQTLLNQAMVANDMATARGIFQEISHDIASTEVGASTFELTDALAEAWEYYRVARTSPGLQGITYGWDFLDQITGGLRGGDVATIVARPGLGKSFSITKAAVAAWRAGASVAFVSMEMTAVETARRIISMETGVNPDFLLRGRMSEWGEENVEHYLAGLAGRPPFTLLVGDLSKSVSDVDALIQERAPDFVCIDASYLLNPSEAKYKGKRWEALAQVGTEIKGLALRRNKPILQTVQFNRSASPDEEMDLSQIGGTDIVGQVSSLVIGMRRGAAPFERSRRRYMVLKNRHGPDHMDFQTRFEFSPFNMDLVTDRPAAEDEDGEWNGVIGEQPANTEWSAV